MTHPPGDAPTVSPSTGVLPVPPATEPPVDRPISDDLPEVGRRYIWLMTLAQFGVFVAFITPLAISLAIRVKQLAPGHEEYLGYLTGAGAGAVILAGPLMGVVSDRTRTRWGRRRPYLIGGTVLGIPALLVMATAPSILLLGAGWMLTQLTWGTTYAMLLTINADQLPESQRGRVAGLMGFATQIAPVVGVGLVGAVAGNNLLLFVVPGAIGVLVVALFVTLVTEPDNRRLSLGDPIGVGGVFRSYLYNPRRYPDYSWNWLGRFAFYFGLSLNTTFTAFFFAQRLGVAVDKIAGMLATVALASIVATTVGALGGGFLSDKLRRRRVFVLLSATLFAVGAVTMALSSGLAVLVTGSLLSSVGIGMFSAVDQALLMDVLPEREKAAGRFMSIMGFAVSIPQAIAPLIAPVFLVIGASGGAKNYTLLYLLAGVFTLLGGIAVLRVRSVR